MSRVSSQEDIHFTLDLSVILCYCGNLSAKYISSCECIRPQSLRLPVHFFVMSIIARYSILSKLSSVGKILLFFVTLRSCRLKPSIAFVVYISVLTASGYLKYVDKLTQFARHDSAIFGYLPLHFSSKLSSSESAVCSSIAA